MSKPTLKLDWCSHEAAYFAVMNWHYSKAMPAGKLAKIGVWEDGRFIGSVIYGLGATPNLCKSYGLTQQTCCELVRVALNKHSATVSRIIAISLKILKRDMPGLRLVVSFADTSKGHHGGIYQAGGWIYTGRSDNSRYFFVHNKEMHPRTIGASGWIQSEKWLKKNVDPNAKAIKKPGKYRYLMPLDDDMKRHIMLLAKPYPKRAGSAASGTSINQIEREGATPIPALSSSMEDGVV